ncbi:hypothetical protein HDU76_000851 [Blyttiomyces sp. JEL0837]|nr:hypothetical protein HDU76_000851 [Blyttiomyces sp. JEL0837]
MNDSNDRSRQLPLDERPFLNSEIHNFAVYCPKSGEHDIRTSTFNESNSSEPVDLLFIPLIHLQNNINLKRKGAGSATSAVTDDRKIHLDIAGLEVRKSTLIQPFSRNTVGNLAELMSETPKFHQGVQAEASPRLLQKIESNELKIVKILRALRQRWNISAKPPVVLLTDFGLSIWDSVKDWINGFVLHDMLMDPSGNMKIRFTSERLHFEEKMRTLKGEIGLRDDFCVLGIEAVKAGPDNLSHELKRHIMAWYSGHGFKFWVCHFSQFSDISDIRPFSHKELGSDMLEIATLPSVKKCRRIAEMCYVELLDTGVDLAVVEMDIWNQVLKELSSLPKEFIEIIKDEILKVTWSDFIDVMDDKRLFPIPPFYSSLQGLLQFAINQITKEVSQKTPTSPTTQADATLTHVSVNHIGYSYGKQRAEEVSKSVLAVLLQLKEKTLLATFRYNNDLGMNKDNFSQAFTNTVNLFESIIDNPTPATKWLLEVLHTNRNKNVLQDLSNLTSRLKLDTVAVYLAKKAAFIPKETVNFPYKSIWAVTHQEDNVLYIFISDDHPCIEEVIIHSYMKHVKGWSTGDCILMEAIISAQKCAEEDFPIPFPARICHEIDGASRSSWMDLIRNHESKIREINHSEQSEREKAYLIELCTFVSRRADFLLVERERFTDAMLVKLSNGYIPNNELESRLGKAGQEQHLLAVCFLVFVVYKACRRCAFMELEVAIQDLSTAFLPDKDQVAVSLEMSTTQTNMQEIFNLSSLQLATTFHERVRIRMKEAEFEQEELALHDVEQFSAKNVDFSVSKYLGNAYIYVYPIFIDFMLSNIFGSGIFFSSLMSEETLDAATLAFIVSFPFMGAIMNSFGRTMTFYFYQKSITLMIMAISHRLAAAFICLGFVGLLVSAVIYSYEFDWVSMLFGFVYAYAFGLFMVMYTVLVCLSDPEVYWWQSGGTATAMLALVLFVPVPLICTFVLKVGTDDRIVWAMYAFALIMSTIFMMLRFSTIANQFLRWPENVKITDTKEIESWFSKIMPRPEQKPDEKQDVYDKRARLWERSATELFAARMEVAINRPMFLKIPVLKARVAQWKWERPLMTWFLERSGIDPRSVKPFSPRWDNLAKQGIDELKKKFQTEKLNRGALLFNMEAPAIVFGFLYFIIIFMDKWALLIANQTLRSFLPNVDHFNRGITFATIFLLASSGFLELSLHSCSAQMKRFKFRTLSSVDNPVKLVQEYQIFITSIYKKELLQITLNACGVFVATSALTIGLSWYQSSLTTIKVFFIACFAYFGLLLGLFNKIFIQTKEWKLNAILAVGMAFSLVISAGLIRAFHSAFWAISATVLSCWSFGLACTLVRYYEYVQTPHYEISIAPHLRSSGQKYIGYKDDWTSTQERDAYAAKLLREKHKHASIDPGSPLGKSIQSVFKNFSNIVEVSKIENPLHMAIKDLRNILHEAVQHFQNGKIVVHQVKHALEADGIRFSALAVTEGSTLLIFINSKVTNMDDQTSVVCEAIVHEVIERAGWSHSTAVAVEICLAESMTAQIPNPQEVNLKIRELLSTAPNTIPTTLATLTCHSGSEIDLTSAIYRHVLLCRLADQIKVKSMEVVKKCENMDSIKMESSILQDLAKVSRRKMRNNASIKQFLHKAYTGLVRVHYYAYTNGSNQVTRVDVCDGSYIRVSIVRAIDVNNDPEEYSSGTDLPPLEVLRFEGGKPADWTPKDSDKPMSKGTFELITRKGKMTSIDNYRITMEHFYDGQKKVTRTHLYRYQSSTEIFPMLRYVFDKDAPRNWTADQSSLTPIETHLFDIKAKGKVTSAIISRTCKKTNQAIDVHVKYSYDNESHGMGPKTANFSSDMPHPWEILVEYAPYSMPDTPARVWCVRYRKGGEAGSFVTRFDYSHPKHATHDTIYSVDETLDSLANVKGTPVSTPDEILDDTYNILSFIAPPSIYDSNDLLRKGFKRRDFRKFSISWPFVRTQYTEYTSDPYDTRRRRDMLWTSWRGGLIPGAFARNLDEQILRDDPDLKDYWRYRNIGSVNRALKALKDHREGLNNSLYVADRPASRTSLQLRFSDLAIFGIGGDSSNIAAFDRNGPDAVDGQETLDVISLDSGTWPTGGGGVGSCRRDLIDSLQRIRWTAIAEVSTAELEQRDYQIEKHIKAIIYIPIFDVDFGNPYENIYRSHTYMDLQERQLRTTDTIITGQFVPLIKQLIEACLEENLSSDRLRHYQNIFVSLYKYLQDYDWTSSWNHPASQRVCIMTFFDTAAAMHRSKKIMNFETPTLSHISILVTLFSRLLLPLCFTVPCIPVVHVSHHGTQALQGVIAKVVNGSRLVIWDHGMLWRERLFGLCKDGMPAFVQIGFSGLTRLCTRVVYSCADYVTPCTSVQNIMWAAWLSGGKYGDDQQASELLKRCAPVLNGMNLSKFSVKRESALKTPTAVMLSHISPVKDVMNAIRAAFYIVHEFKLATYQLHIYGSPHKDQAYTLACKSAISEFRLEKNVFMKGLGNPTNVLPTGWIFVNSSITEGLPLALGEAGLCGLPVVCTDVGGSREVISDMRTGAIYGAVVPPSRSRQLAIGQLQVFAMSDGLDVLSNPSTKVDKVSFEELVSKEGALEKRIMDPEVCSLRENLGMMLRAKTQSALSIARYWREHEQILWTGPLYDRLNKVKRVDRGEEIEMGSH